MTREIVITGASGFVGQELARQLKGSGFSVTALSRQRRKGVSTVDNYADAKNAEGAVLVHLAQGRDTSGIFGEEDIELCRKLSSKPWRHIIYASSAVVYGDDKEYPRMPDEKVYANSDYTRVKLACEEIVSNAGGTSLRFTNLYGPGMGSNTVIADILRQIPGQGPLILRDLTPVRDFLWIEDAVSCVVFACRVMPGYILNAGSGSGIAVGDVARLALRLAGEASRPVIGKKNSETLSSLTVDITKSKTVLGWTPAVDIEAGLLKLLSLDNNRND